MFVFDIGAILKAIGTPSEIRRKLEALGVNPLPSTKTIQKWRERNSLPSDWLAKVMMIPTLERRSILDVRQYITREQSNG